MSSCPSCDADVSGDAAVCSVCGTRLDDDTPDDPGEYRQQLLIELIAERTGVAALARRFPGEGLYPPYLLVAIAAVIDLGVIDLYNYVVAGKTSWITDPVTPLTLALGVVLAVIGVRYMADEYADAVSRLRLHDRPGSVDVDAFRGVVSLRTKFAFYAVGLALYYLNLFFGVGIGTLIEVDGVVAVVLGQFVLAPLVNLALVVEFALLFFGIHFLLPRRLERADLDLFFHDPRNMGGFGAVGQLLKRSYYVYTAGVLVYFLVAYGKVILSNVVDSPLPTPGVQVAVFFTLAWALGFASILHSMHRVHRIMSERKDRRIRQLEDDVRALTANPYDIRSSRVTDQEAMETKERQLERVRSTRTYPTTFTMWSQIAVSVLLPQALQLVVQATL